MLNKNMRRFNRMFAAEGNGAGNGQGPMNGNGMGAGPMNGAGKSQAGCGDDNHEHGEEKGKGKRCGARRGKCFGGNEHDHDEEHEHGEKEKRKGEGKKHGKGHGRSKDHEHEIEKGTDPMEKKDGTGPRAEAGLCDKC